MDPLSISAAVTGFITLVAATIVATNNYVSAVRDANESVKLLLVELQTLQQNLDRFDGYLRTAGNAGSVMKQDSVLALQMAACQTCLEDLQRRLIADRQKKARNLLWPLSEKSHRKTIQDVRAFCQCIAFSLSLENCALLLRTTRDSEKTLEQQLESLSLLQKVQSQNAAIQGAVAIQTRLLVETWGAEMRRELLDWISPPGHLEKHALIQSARAFDTGSWLLRRIEFQKWNEDADNCGLLWCHGIPGSGKTVLTSRVIDHLRRPGSILSFFYFDYLDAKSQNYSAMLSSILRQTIEQLTANGSTAWIRQLRAKFEQGRTPLSPQDKEKAVVAAAMATGRLYIALDALDECEDARERTRVLGLVQRLGAFKQVRIFATSRQHYRDIEQAFRQGHRLEILADQKDLATFISREISESGVDDIVDPELAEKIVDGVTRNAGGMFLLAIIHLRSILQEPTPGDMMDALECLSDSLSEAFGNTLDRIQRLPKRRKEFAMSILMWVCYAKRVMTEDELSDALSIRPGQTNASPSHRPATRVMLECCLGLVKVDQGVGVVPVHHAIQEYLMEHADELFPKARQTIAEHCVTYLLFDCFSSGPKDNTDEVNALMWSNPFISYVGTHWPSHVSDVGADAKVKSLCHQLFQSPNVQAFAVQIVAFLEGYREEYWTGPEPYSYTALHVAVGGGFTDIVKDMLRSEAIDLNQPTCIGSTPIGIAASRSNIEIVKLLLAAGADPHQQSWFGDALHTAAEAGRAESIRLLVEWCGMDPNMSINQFGRRPIDCTLDKDSADAFEVLVELGADITTAREDFTPFHEAVDEYKPNIIDVALRKHLVDTEQRTLGDSRTALHLAAQSGYPDLIRKLLEHGADVSAEDNDGRTPRDLVPDEEWAAEARQVFDDWLTTCI